MTRVSCLDQASQPEGSVFWIAWNGKVPSRAGWGVTGRVDWTAGQKWDETCLPEVAEAGGRATM